MPLPFPHPLMTPENPDYRTELPAPPKGRLALAKVACPCHRPTCCPGPSFPHTPLNAPNRETEKFGPPGRGGVDTGKEGNPVYKGLGKGEGA